MVTVVLQEQIVAKAIEVADAEGLDQVSMRTLAVKLGVGTMTLYSYVESKDHLLDLMQEAVLAEVLLPDDLPDDWRAALHLLARQTYDTFTRHTWLVERLGWIHVAGPNSVKGIEQNLAAIASLGLDWPTAERFLRTVYDYTFGCAVRGLALERAGRKRFPDAAVSGGMSPAARRLVETGDLPYVAQVLHEQDGRRPERHDFDEGLEIVLDGIAAQLAAGANRA
jgi:AcrR family transcriptional regulator